MTAVARSSAASPPTASAPTERRYRSKDGKRCARPTTAAIRLVHLAVVGRALRLPSLRHIDQPVRPLPHRRSEHQPRPASQEAQSSDRSYWTEPRRAAEREQIQAAAKE